MHPKKKIKPSNGRACLKGQVCFAGCRLQVEKWTFKSELVYLALRLA